MTRFLSLKRVAFSIVATCGAMGAATAAEPYDMGVMEPGVTYTYPAYAVVTGEYTPSVTGPVKFVYSTNPLALYTSRDMRTSRLWLASMPTLPEGRS